MANITGLANPFVPGELEYKRVTFNLEKGKYYKPSRTSLLLLTGFGEIPGAAATQDQKKTSLALESRELDQLEFEILTHDARLSQTTTFVAGSLPNGTKGTGSTYSVSDASIFRPFDVIENMNTGEQLLVTATDTSASPDEITAFPAFSQTGFSGITAFPAPALTDDAPQAKTAGDTIRIIGTAFPAGSNASTIVDTRPTTAVNYMQIFREDYGVTHEEHVQAKHGRMDITDKEERATANLLVKLEKALVEGSINKETVNSETIRTMQGIKGTVSTFNQTASSLVGGGNDITVPKLDQIAEQIAEGNTSGRAVCLCSGEFIRKLRELKDNKTEMQTVVGSDDFGVKAFRYEAPSLSIDFVHHDIFDATGNSDEALFIDPDHFSLVHLKGCEIGKVSQKKGIPGGTLVANDKMAMQDAIYGAYSLDYRHENGSALVTGLAHSIAS